MDPSPIKIAALRRGCTQIQLARQSGINPRRWYRLIEGLAVPTEEELVRITIVTGLQLQDVRRAFDASGEKLLRDHAGLQSEHP